MLKPIVVAVFSLTLVMAVVFTGSAPEPVYKLFPGYFADPNKSWEQTPLTFGAVTEARLPQAIIDDRNNRQAVARNTLFVEQDKQILFGDTHVHTTNSADAFMYSLQRNACSLMNFSMSMHAYDPPQQRNT